MNLTFANPLALWALLGIPAILLIHFLQKERREIVTSTLFLLDELHRESKTGARFERLRNSLPLWLQILAVLLLTWILAQPRWLRPDSFQRVVLVLDSSASMSAFRDTALSRLDHEIRQLAAASARTEWIATETDPRRPTLYSGDDLAALRAALQNWQPISPTHDIAPALERARALLRQRGTVLFLTNRPRSQLPSGVAAISIGSPLPNVGFTGLRVETRPEGHVWHVLARNYSDQPQTRQWHAAFENSAAPPRDLHLEPNQTVALSGLFPPNENTGFLQFSDDPFAHDNRLPLARPQPKSLLILAEDHPALATFAEPFLRSLPASRPPNSTETEDLRIATRLPSQIHPTRPGIYFLAETEPPTQRLTAPLVAENHPLTRDLNWQGLLIQAAAEPTREDSDQVLLWQGDRPLIVLRETARERRLFCNFDLRYSNAGRLPAFIVLLHRFLEETRDAKPAFSRRNLQTAQLISTGVNPIGAPVTLQFRTADGTETVQQLEAYRATRLPAPDTPGFWQISQNEQPLLEAAIHFADSRESDLRDAATEVTGPTLTPAQYEQNTTADFLTPLWLLLLTTILLLNYRLTAPVK